MLSKVGLLARTCGNVCKGSGRSSRLMSDYGHPPVKQITYNDLPVPSGSWQKAYSAKQSRYNIYLLSSILFFSGTAAYVYTAGTFSYLRSPLRLKLD